VRWAGGARPCPAVAPRAAALLRLLIEDLGLGVLRARYSVVHPGTVIRPHCGPTNLRWTAHLGLDVPEPLCTWMTVRGAAGGSAAAAEAVEEDAAEEEAVVRWGDGQVLLFDDSFEHAVTHAGSRPRTVLHVDFVHPLEWARMRDPS